MSDDQLNGRILVIMLVVGGIMATGVVAAASTTVTSGVPFQTNSGLTVTTGVGITQDTTTLFPNSNSVELQGVNFSSTTGGSVTVNKYTGDITELSQINAIGHDIRIDPPNKPAATVSGGIDTFEFAEPALDDNSVDFRYAASATGTVTLNGLPSGTRVGALANNGDEVGVGTVGPNGAVTIELKPGNFREIKLISDPRLPSIDRSTASPTTDIDPGTTVDFEATVDDLGFATDSLTAEFYLNGKPIGTDTITQTGAIKQTNSTPTIGGDQAWNISLSNSQGVTVSTDANLAQAGNQSFSFRIPSELKIRNASDPSQLVTQSTAEITFFGESTVATRTDSDQDGKVAFDGLPLDERFEASVNATGFETRTVVISSLFEQDVVYMLPDDVSTVQPRFVLDSAVQEFDERNSEIIIERPINTSGSLDFATVTESSFGSNGYNIKLEEDQRYRLTVRAPSGQTRQIGSYRATATEQVTLQIESGSFDATETVNGVDFAARFTDNSNVQASVKSVDISTSSVEIIRRNDSTTVFSDSSGGNFSTAVPVSNQAEYIVNMSATLQSGETVTHTQRVAPNQFATARSLDPKWQNLLAMALLLVVAGLFTRANAGIGSIATAGVGGILFYLGWLNGVATGLAVVVAMLIGVLAYARQQRSGVPT
jgi:hypothetical protein